MLLLMNPYQQDNIRLRDICALADSFSLGASFHSTTLDGTLPPRTARTPRPCLSGLHPPWGHLHVNYSAISPSPTASARGPPSWSKTSSPPPYQSVCFK